LGQAGQAGGKGGFWHGLGHHVLEGIKSHLPHMHDNLHRQNLPASGLHAMGAPFSGLMGGLGFLVGRGIGGILNRSAMKNLPKFLAQKPGFTLEPKKFGHVIQNRAKDIASPHSSKAYSHFMEANKEFENATPLEGKERVYQNFIKEMNVEAQGMDDNLGPGMGKGVYDNVARYLAENHNALAQEYIERSGSKTG